MGEIKTEMLYKTFLQSSCQHFSNSFICYLYDYLVFKKTFEIFRDSIIECQINIFFILPSKWVFLCIFQKNKLNNIVNK